MTTEGYVITSWTENCQDALSTASVSPRASGHYGFSCRQEIALPSGITNGTQAGSSHIVFILQRHKTALGFDFIYERMKKWSNIIGILPIKINMLPHPQWYQAPKEDHRGLPTGEQSYIENILRLNIGNPGTFNFSFEHAVRSGFNTLAVTGVVEQAGRDHVIIKEESTGHSYLFPMIYFDFAEFEDGVNYFPQQPTTTTTTTTTTTNNNRDNQECKKSSASLMWAAEDFFCRKRKKKVLCFTVYVLQLRQSA